jgi:ribosomal protein S18 acetylase RimI-like enzyme
MAEPRSLIAPITVADLPAITRMVYTNMTGVDEEFTQFISHPFGRLAGYLMMPLYLLLGGQGYKAVYGRHIAGCAYLYLRRRSGYVFNVNVNAEFRRQGVASELMNHLESVARAKDQRWLALHVDAQNSPARALYQKLGYREYCPYYLQRIAKEPLSLQAVGQRVSLEPLGRNEARRVFQRFAALERVQGDSWLDQVVATDFAPQLPLGGVHCLCRLRGTEMGYAWIGGAPGHAVLFLFFKPDYWGDWATAAVVAQLLNKVEQPVSEIDIHLGSSQHYESALTLFESLAFRPATRPRILMLKRVG